MKRTTLQYKVHVALSKLERYNALAELEQPGTASGAAEAAIITMALTRGHGAMFFRPSYFALRNMKQRGTD